MNICNFYKSKVYNMEERLTEEKISIDNANCIPTLYISRSELKNADGDMFDFWGLYNDTDLKPGDFIGMYNGIWIHESEGFSFGHKYAIELSHGMMVAPPGQRPNPQKYPIAMANEPHKDGEANSTMVELIFGREHIDNIPHDVKDERFYGIGMFACKDIPKGTEILWFYGDSYAKNVTQRNTKPLHKDVQLTGLQSSESSITR